MLLKIKTSSKAQRYKNLIFVLTLTIIIKSVECLYTNKPAYKIREIINQQTAFSLQSNVTLVVYSCGALLDLKQTVLSFFYYNTYPLNQMIVVDRCQTPQFDIKNAFLQQKLENSQIQKYIKVITMKGSDLQQLQKAFQMVTTPYVVLIPNKWITFDGLGFIQQAIDAIQYGQKNNIKISQVTSLFPEWKKFRALSRYTKTDSGTVFYEIRSFKPINRYYFTLNPSLLNFDLIFNKIMKGSFQKYCDMKQCHGSASQLRDCFEKQLGNQLYQNNNYFQAFIDDGSVQAKLFYVD